MFPATVTESSFVVNIFGDGILENNETIQLNIMISSLLKRVILGNPSQSTITIIDNDCKLATRSYSYIIMRPCTYIYIIIFVAIKVRFNDSTYRVSESDGLVQPVLLFSNPSSTDITVRVISTNNNATGKLNHIM